MASIPGGAYPAYADAQLRELIERVRAGRALERHRLARPPGALFRLFADYYGAVPEGVLNDRWLTTSWVTTALRFRPLQKLADRVPEARRHERQGRPHARRARPTATRARPSTPSSRAARREKWECVRGIDKSFGYNRILAARRTSSRRAS